MRGGSSLMCLFGREALVTTVCWQVVVVSVTVNGKGKIYYFSSTTSI